MEKTPNDYLESHIYTLANLGHLAHLKKDPEKAMEYYTQALTVAKSMNHSYSMIEIKQDISTLCSEEYFQKYLHSFDEHLQPE